MDHTSQPATGRTAPPLGGSPRSPRRRARPAARASAAPAFEPLEARRLCAGNDLVINEFMAKNDNGLKAADGSRPDWIEVYNPGASDTDLANWTIAEADTDGGNAVFTVPDTNAAVTTVPAGGYKVIYCDNLSPGINAASEIHANFKLDKSGGSLVLKKPDGTTTSAFDPYPEQISDTSYGPGPAITTVGQLATPTAPVTVTVPNAGTPATWNQPGFGDSTWTTGHAGIGFENIAAGGQPVALPNEVEANDSVAAANDATTNFSSVAASNLYQLSVTTAALSSATDVDYYKLGALDAGDLLSVTAFGSGTFGTGANTALTLYRGTNTASLTTVTSDTNSGPGSDGLIDRFAIATTDTYYVAVPANSTFGMYQLGAYVTNKSGTTAPTTGGTVTAEVESNNTAATATNVSSSWRQVQYASHTAAALGAATDADFYKYTFTAGDRVTINADSAGVTDMRLTLYAANGTTVVAAEDGTSTRTTPYDKDSTIYAFAIPTTGTYYVKAAGDVAGSYALDVQLSTTTAPPTPGLGSPIYGALIATNVGAAMQNVNASAYVRIPFSVSDSVSISTLTLSMKYEDGFVAYLNGQEVARANAPGTAGTAPAYNAAAASDRADGAALASQDFDLTAFKSALVVNGANVLAIQGLNNSASDPRFVLAPELKYATIVQPGNQYFATPTPGAANAAGSLGQVADTKFNIGRGFYTTPQDVAITTSTPAASIRYTLDGTEPTATNGTAYVGPVHVAGLTTLRAVAYKAGYLSSDVDTETYLFTADVANQAVPSANFPTSKYPATWSGTYTADYNVDYADATAGGGTNAEYAAGLVDPNVPTISIVTDPGSLFDPNTGIYQNPLQEGSDWERGASVELINPDGSAGFQINAGLRIQGSAARQPGNQPKHSFRALFKSEYGDSSLNFPIFGPGSDGLDTLDFRATYNNSWTQNNAAQRDGAEYIRDGWNRVTQAAMGQPAARQKFVQLYLNGLYWGLYDITDRPESSWAANELGGSKDQYEVVNAGTAVDGPPTASDPDGTARTASDWTTLFSTINNANISTPAGYDNAVQNWIDPTNLADYIIQNFYGGNKDWDFHNYYAYRDTSATSTDKGWRFVSWDAERTLESATENITSLNTANEPTRIFRQMMTNAEFRVLFADRVHAAFFNNGALTPAQAGARYAAMMDEIKNAIVDESARWGDYRAGTGTPYGKAKWNTETSRLINSYFPVRTNNVLGEFSTNGWYPTVAAPEFNGAFGGNVAAPYAVDVSNANGDGSVVYYTTDGTDPRLYGGAVSSTALAYDPNSKPILTSAARVKMRVLLNGTWSALTDATFFAGPAPSVRVGEVMYHAKPDAGTSAYSDDDYDYVELVNTGATPVSLAGFTLGGGIDYTFPASGAPTLQAGQRVVIPDNVMAFAARYGTAGGALVTATAYSGNLSNSGETVAFATALGQPIETFTYSDGWYSATDGDGYSMVPVNPNADDATLSTLAGWRAGAVLNGTPGQAEPPAFTGVVVGDGSSQRSMVTRLAIGFDQTVAAFDAAAFALTRRDPAGGASVPVPFAAALAPDGLSVALTFTGADVVAGSLSDGIYDLLVNPSLVRNAAGQAATGIAQTTTFHRLYGDLNGDKTTNNADNFQFKSAYLKSLGDPGYIAALDVNGDGTVNNADNFQFKQRYLKSMDY